MTAPLCLLLAALAGTPEVGLSVAFSVKVGADRERVVLELVEKGLADEGLPTRRFDARCSGEVTCSTDVARREGLSGLVLVTLAAAQKNVAVDLEAFRVEDRSSVAQTTFTLTGKKLDEKALEKLRAFALAAAPAFAPRPVAVLPADAPKVTPVLAPPPPRPAPAEVVASPPAPSRRSVVPGALLFGGAAVGAGASVWLGLSGLSAQRQLEASPDGIHSALTEPQARALAVEANGRYTASLVAGMAAGALATAAVVWLVTGN